MKKKILLSLLLALIMLFSVASPALAKPGKFEQVSIDPGVGQANLRVDKDNNLVTSITLRKAIPDKTYQIRLMFNGYHVLGDLTIDSKGVGTFKEVIPPSAAWLGWFGTGKIELMVGTICYFRSATIPLDFR